MKTAVVYARYSSDNQTEQSIEGQLRVCEQYAKNNDIMILDTYIDRAMTGTNDNRPDFQRMIKDSEKHEWQYILVYKIDRFSRNKYETAKYKKILKDNGVKLLSAMENIPDTPEGIILESLLEGMAEYYSAELSQKVKRGMNETRLKGNYTGGQLLYGYKVENHKIIIDEEKAKTVSYIYEQYSLGVYVKDIIQHLTQNHIYNRGKPFARNTVYSILKNEKYSGIYRFNNEIFTNMYPQVVPTELYEKVKHRTELNKYGKRSVKVTYLLRNKLKCGYCGQTITGESGTSRAGHRVYYYKCLGRKHHNGCNKSILRKEDLENFIINKILEILQSPKYMNKIVDSLMRIQNSENRNTLLNSLLKEQTRVQTALNNIITAIEQGVLNHTTSTRMNELETQLSEIEKQILIERSKSSQHLSRDEIMKYYLDGLRLESKLLIECLIKEIIVYDDKVVIKFNSPTKTSPEPQGFCFDIK